MGATKERDPVSGPITHVSQVRARTTEAAPALEGFRRLVGELIEHVPAATFALDDRGRFFHANTRFESLVGFSRRSFVGEGMCERLVPAASRSEIRRHLDQVLSGELDTFVATFDTAHGSLVEAECETRRYGPSESSLWLVTVSHTEVRRPTHGEAFGGAVYEVVQGADRSLALAAGSDVGAPCHRVLHQREQICETCPARQALATGRSAEAAWVGPADHLLHVVRAIPIGERHARCERIALPETTSELVARARADARIDAAHLSPRERDVLAYLRLGRTLDEVATFLSISQHTVKFHTANLLQKLGADSRLDLLRILG